MIRDRRQLYWHARLCDAYPTLEIRAPDVQLDVDTAVTLAGIARALVATALREGRRGRGRWTRRPAFSRPRAGTPHATG